MSSNREGVSHLVDGDGSVEVGDEVVGICGFAYTSKGTKDLPVCSSCVDVILREQADAVAVIRDMDSRLRQIAGAIALKDELGQENWIHHVSGQELYNAFWRPGPSRLEGPHREDGSF